jgi:hypothetical protein
MSIAIKTDCFDNVIGLSRTECECVDITIDVSESGLYLDELEGLNLTVLDGSAECVKGSLLDMMNVAREQAIMAFKSDYAVNIGKNWKYSRAAFKGQIGKPKASTNYTTGNYAGHRYIFAPVKNGFWKITRIGVLFNTTGTVDIEIFDNVTAAALHTYANVPTVANTLTWYTLPDPIYLPMHSEQEDYLQYFILYGNPGFSPKKNNFSCCGMSLTFNCLAPILAPNENNGAYTFKKWCNVTGVTGSTVDAIREANAGFNDNAMGLVIDSVMQCDAQSMACNETEFDRNAIAKVMAYAVWYRAGVFLINAILSSTNINRFTMLDREPLYGKRAHYGKEYDNRLFWLTNPDVDEVKTHLLQTGCLECIRRMKMGSML